MVQAAQSAKMRGMLPGCIEQMIASELEPKLDWRDVLRRFVTQTREDYSWLPPNRRFIYQGLYLPSIHGEGIREIVLAIDTSGSISDEALKRFLTEIEGYMQDFPTSLLHVVQCDAQVHGHEVMSASDLPLSFKVKGRGGTAFRPVFDFVDENDIRPVCLVYLTDLYGDNPSPPDYPVLWVSTGGDNPPFGELVKLEV